MSKTVNPVSYVIIHEWVFELLCQGNEFSISDVMEHVPMSEYRYEDNFEELYTLMANYAFDEIEGISEEFGFNPELCIDYDTEDDDLKHFEEDRVLADSNGCLNIPKSIVKKLEKSLIHTAAMGVFGNEVIICDSQNPELANAKSIIFNNPISWKNGTPRISLNLEKYFEDESENKCYFVWYDENQHVIHIVH